VHTEGLQPTIHPYNCEPIRKTGNTREFLDSMRRLRAECQEVNRGAFRSFLLSKRNAAWYSDAAYPAGCRALHPESAVK
jgi:hypothetical protein